MIKTIKVHIDGFKIDWFIGIFDFEYEKAQAVQFDIELTVVAPPNSEKDDYDDVVCYKTIIESIQALEKTGHIRLVETLGNKVANLCLVDKRVLNAIVKVSKLDAFNFVSNVGITVEKSQA